MKERLDRRIKEDSKFNNRKMEIIRNIKKYYTKIKNLSKILLDEW